MFVTYHQTIFRNQESGETIFYVIPEKVMEYTKNNLLQCKGIIGIYNEGTPLEISGYFDGVYFCVTECSIPYKTRGNVVRILEYTVKNLTDRQISLIADKAENDLFGFIERTDCREILLDIFKRTKDPDRLSQKVMDQIQKLKNQEELTLELMRYEVSIDKIELLYRKGISLDELDKNPYMIFSRYGIPINKAEMFLQRKRAIEAYSIVRLCGFTYDSMLYILTEGNTCCTLDTLTKTVNWRLRKYGLVETSVTKSLINLCIKELNRYMNYHIVNGKPYIYLNHVWNEETTAINHVIRLQQDKRTFHPQLSVEEIEKKLNIIYNPEQKNAFKSVCSSGIKILTGPPGSGKTSVIKGLIEYFGENRSIKLAATTGMAAMVMNKTCQMHSETVNKMLEVMPFEEGGVKGRNINDPVEADLIIIDEVSMLGTQLFSILVQAVKSGSILLLVGDEDQLQSVEYGNILHELIQSGIVDIYRLTEIIRQSGTICENAKKVNNGNTDIINDSTFMVYNCQDNTSALSLLLKNISEEHGQVLAPMRKSDIGIDSLNDVLRNKEGELLTVYGKKEFHMHDKIIMTKNNYEKNYINGDIGLIVGFEEESLIVKFPLKTLRLDRQDMHDMDFAYAITIHKGQGSEFDVVHIVLPIEAAHMMSRRLLYTAITRAKKRVFIYSTGSALRNAVQNKGNAIRHTIFSERLMLAKMNQ